MRRLVLVGVVAVVVGIAGCAAGGDDKGSSGTTVEGTGIVGDWFPCADDSCNSPAFDYGSRFRADGHCELLGHRTADDTYCNDGDVAVQGITVTCTYDGSSITQTSSTEHSGPYATDHLDYTVNGNVLSVTDPSSGQVWRYARVADNSVGICLWEGDACQQSGQCDSGRCEQGICALP